MQDVHHLELLHHPELELAGTVHHFGGKVAAGESVRDHDGVDGGRVGLDAPVQPPILGLGLLDNVVTTSISFNWHDLLDEERHSLSATACNDIGGLTYGPLSMSVIASYQFPRRCGRTSRSPWSWERFA